ncbi:MAG: hypothetical protein HY055_14755 [Magnetospirillum sp.]|nr:hypothetical protein [Magnetospirillum sp.]
MPATLLLLAGEAERPVLAALLRSVASGLRVMEIARVADLPRDLETLSQARLVAFLFSEIVPAEVLEGLGFGAYNIHPGPPEYPGWMPVSFALYDGAPRFGATIHEMAVKVDAGTICDVENFDVPADATQASLSELTYAASLKLFRRWAEVLAMPPLKLPRLPLKWSGRSCTKRGFAKLARIAQAASEEEVRRRIQAFGDGDGFTPPTTAPWT